MPSVPMATMGGVSKQAIGIRGNVIRSRDGICYIDHYVLSYIRVITYGYYHSEIYIGKHECECLIDEKSIKIMRK